MKKDKGITLIALIVTIIVLLILAGITIGAITGDNGIINQAQSAKTETERSDIEEQINVILVQNSKDRVMDKNKLINDFEEKLPDGKEIVESDDLIYIIYPEYSFEVDIDSLEVNDITKYIEVSKKLKVGDYVEYNPQNEVTTYLIEEKYSGSANQTIQQEQFRWRILNINKNGTVDLISDSPTTDRLQLTGAIGYNNGVTLLNNICNTLYGNADLEANARSVNIEDLQDKMDLSVWNYKEDITSEGHKYGEFYEYTGEFPSMIKEDIKFENNCKSFNILDFNDQNSAISGPETLMLKNTVWNNELSKENFKKVETRSNPNDSDIYYTLLYKNYIWFATRSIYFWNNNFAYFGLMINNNRIYIAYLMYGGQIGNDEEGILPIVNISIDKINTDISYEENDVWKLR